MNLSSLRTRLLTKPEAWEDFPFGPEPAVFKLKTKVFALLFEQDGIEKVNLKCNPDKAIELRDMFDGIVPGYHMNKRHWNTISLDGSVPASEVEYLVDHSYELILGSLLKKDRLALEAKYSKALLYT